MLRMPELGEDDDIDLVMEKLIRKGVWIAWRRGFEAGVVTGEAVANNEPLPQAARDYLAGVSEEEEAQANWP